MLRRALPARLAGGVTLSLDLLAGRSGGNNVFDRRFGVRSSPANEHLVAVERSVSGRQFSPPPKRGVGVSRAKRGQGTRWMGVVGGQGLP